VEALANNGISVFHYAIRGESFAVLVADYFLDEFEFFTVHDRGTSGQPLHLAAFNGKANAAQWIIGRGAKVDVNRAENVTPLMGACANGKIDVARVLLQAGASIDRATSSSLGLEACYGQSLMARELVLWKPPRRRRARQQSPYSRYKHTFATNSWIESYSVAAQQRLVCLSVPCL
jgi:hypothetical protein